MKRAANSVAGDSYTSSGVPICTNCPLFIRKMRSLIVIASS